MKRITGEIRGRPTSFNVLNWRPPPVRRLEHLVIACGSCQGVKWLRLRIPADRSKTMLTPQFISMPNRATLCLVVLCSFASHVPAGQINTDNSGSWSGTIVYSSCNADEAFAESPECSRAAPDAKLSLYDDTSRVIYGLEPQQLIRGHLGDSVTVHGTLDDASIHVASIELMSIGLEVGLKAPAFSARDQFGRVQTLDTLRGPKGTVLLFFRSADW